MNKATTAGFSLNSAAFSTVGNAKTFKATELKVTGYENVSAWQDESAFDCQFLITKIDEFGYTLDDTGMFDVDKAFQLGYVDVYEEGAWIGGFWYDLIKDEEVSADNDREFTLGEGLFVSTPDPVEGEEYKLVSAGQVAGEDNTFPLRAGFNIIANPMPVAIDATDVTISGYEDVTAWQEEGAFDCQVTLTKIDPYGYTLDDTGMFDVDTAFQLGYVDVYEDGAWVGGFWYDLIKDEEVVPESIDFAASEGLWISAPESAEGETYSVKFPSPLVNHDAE